MTPQERQRIEMILECRDTFVGVTKWEEEFLDSVTEQWDDRRTLTDRQVEVLERIWHDRQ